MNRTDILLKLDKITKNIVDKDILDEIADYIEDNFRPYEDE